MDIENIIQSEWIKGTDKPEGYTSFNTMSKYVDIAIDGESECSIGRYCHDRKTWFLTFPDYRQRSEISFWRERPYVKPNHT